jgi:hypothetical protein
MFHLVRRVGGGVLLRRRGDHLDRPRPPHRPDSPPVRDSGLKTLRTVAAILANPRCTGRQVWNRQRTDHDLVDPANTTLGHRQVQRWNLPAGASAPALRARTTAEPRYQRLHPARRIRTSPPARRAGHLPARSLAADDGGLHDRVQLPSHPHLQVGIASVPAARAARLGEPQQWQRRWPSSARPRVVQHRPYSCTRTAAPSASRHLVASRSRPGVQ